MLGTEGLSSRSVARDRLEMTSRIAGQVPRALNSFSRCQTGQHSQGALQVLATLSTACLLLLRWADTLIGRLEGHKGSLLQLNDLGPKLTFPLDR